MNDILAALHARKSMRAYTGEPVSAEKKEMILRAACAAQTAKSGMMHSQLARPKPERCGLKHIVHENVYRRMEAEELQEMLAPHARRTSSRMRSTE